MKYVSNSGDARDWVTGGLLVKQVGCVTYKWADCQLLGKWMEERGGGGGGNCAA